MAQSSTFRAVSSSGDEHKSTVQPSNCGGLIGREVSSIVESAATPTDSRSDSNIFPSCSSVIHRSHVCSAEFSSKNESIQLSQDDSSVSPDNAFNCDVRPSSISLSSGGSENRGHSPVISSRKRMASNPESARCRPWEGRFKRKELSKVDSDTVVDNKHVHSNRKLRDTDITDDVMIEIEEDEMFE